ncbi:MAG: putative zinc-binding metallopeptidase [Prevotella sp.]|nr:putative zinc-binding metallopeptidase [Prevotella sp.]
MKKFIYYSLAWVVGAFTLVACTNDDLSSTSVITVSQTNQNDFDHWLDANFVQPYNIVFAYRYQDIETDPNYYSVPARFEDAVKLAHILKYTCVEAYNEVAGPQFTRMYFPKLFYLTGEWLYRNNGTIILGTAEGGKKIYLHGTNYLTENLKSEATLNEFYLKTIHHEFTHILNQTKNYDEGFQLITGSTYLADSWSSDEGETGYLQRGYISDYSQHSHSEDFAEMMSIYVTNSQEQWDKWMKEAGTEGAKLIAQKLAVVKDYMKTAWNIDIDKLRDSVLSREADVVNGNIDLEDLTI